MAVINPVKLVIENYPEGKVEMVTTEIILKILKVVKRNAFTREIYIEREDFMEEAPKKFSDFLLVMK